MSERVPEGETPTQNQERRIIKLEAEAVTIRQDLNEMIMLVEAAAEVVKELKTDYDKFVKLMMPKVFGEGAAPES